MNEKTYLRAEYRFMGRLHRATWKRTEYDQQFNKLRMAWRRIRSFFDTPNCLCPSYCTRHLKEK